MRSDHGRAAAVRRAPVREFVEAALAGDRLTSTRLAVEFMARTASRPAVISDLFAPAALHVEDLWHAGAASSEGQYRVAICIQAALGALPAPPRIDQPAVSSAILTTMPAEAHQIGLLLVAVALEDDGWVVEFAPQMDVEELVATARRDGLGLVGLSATYDSGGIGAQMAAAVRGLHAIGVPVLGGGSLFQRAPLLARQIHVDAQTQDPRLAVALARRLIRAPRRRRTAGAP